MSQPHNSHSEADDDDDNSLYVFNRSMLQPAPSLPASTAVKSLYVFDRSMLQPSPSLPAFTAVEPRAQSQSSYSGALIDYARMPPPSLPRTFPSPWRGSVAASSGPPQTGPRKNSEGGFHGPPVPEDPRYRNVSREQPLEIMMPESGAAIQRSLPHVQTSGSEFRQGLLPTVSSNVLTRHRVSRSAGRSPLTVSKAALPTASTTSPPPSATERTT